MAEQARILERGYRKYEGRRGGVGASIVTATKHAIQRSLGLKRTVWQKESQNFLASMPFMRHRWNAHVKLQHRLPRL